MILLSLPIAYMLLVLFCTILGAVIGDRMEHRLGVGMVGNQAVRKRVAELVNPAIPVLVCLASCMSSLIVAPFDDFIYVFPATLLGMLLLRLSIVHIRRRHR
jgi:uncharacterized Tic20 family protein